MCKFKKCLTLLLVLSMIVTTVPLDVFANETQGVQNVENKEGEYENGDEKLDNEEVNSDEKEDEAFEEEKSDEKEDEASEKEKIDEKEDEIPEKEKLDEKEDEASEKEKIDEKDDKLSEEEKSDEKEDEASGKEKLDEKEDETSENEKSEDKQENTIKQTKIKSSKIAGRTLATADSGIMTASEDVELTAEYADFYRILHLDCGRKYFTKDWIIALINEMSYAGFTHLELAFGNEGLRFLLDDMSMNVNGTSFSDDAVTAAVQAGNDTYDSKKGYAPEKDELTEDEMDEIIAHAETKGIEIIPLLNNPGHMNAVVSTINTLYGASVGYDGSSSTISLDNTNAVAFTKAFVQKYIDYFKANGCTVFNMGADEYANDVHAQGSMGFGALCSDEKYDLFVQYVNDVAEMIIDANMIPMAFNDGIYFQNPNATYTEEFNKNIMISFWTSGWPGYQSESAYDLAKRGHKMINTNGDQYYVLGKTDQFDTNGYTYAGNFTNTQFMGSTVSDPAGSMFCIWADYPGAETETQIAANTRLIMRAIGLRMKDKSIDNMDTTTVVEGGFAADGTISTEGVSLNKVTDTENTTDVYVTGPNFTHVTATEVEDTTSIKANINVKDVRNIKAWDMIPFADTGAYKEEAIVELPVPADWNTANMGAFVINDDGSITLIKGTYSEGYYKFTMPHFSVGGIYDAVATAEITNTVDVKLAIGETKAFTDTTGAYENAETNVAPNSSVATMTLKDIPGSADVTVSDTAATELEDGATYILRVYDTEYALSSKQGRDDWGTKTLAFEYNTLNAKTKTEHLWILEAAEGGYRIKNSEGYLNLGSGNNAAEVSGTGEVFTFTYTTTGWTVKNQYGRYINALGGLYNYYTAGGWTGDGTRFDLYKVVSATSDSTEIAFKGVAVGTTTAVVGNTQYNITVAEAPLVIEYWITNSRVKESSTNNIIQKAIYSTDANVNTSKGIDVEAVVPEMGYRDGRDVKYWRSRILDRNTNEQTGTDGDDETNSGEGFTKVRYWNDKWQVYTTEWVDLDLNDDQLVAYYMEIVDITNDQGESEVSIYSKDWGTKGDGKHNWGYNPEDTRVGLALQIVYEGGATNPSVADMTNMTADEIAAIATKTFLYADDGGRNIGTMVLESEDYSIYRIVAVHGTMESSENGNYVTINSLEWETNDSNELEGQVVWEGDAVHNLNLLGSSNEALTWRSANDVILLRIYVKTIAAEDNLHVHYIDDVFDSEFYVQDISVKEGTEFKHSLAQDASTPNTLVDNDVINYYGSPQYVNAELKGMSEIGAQYKYSNYQLVSVNFGTNVDDSVNYKDVYLHYTFSPMRYFVADFGLPLTINAIDLDENLNAENVDKIEISSEKTRFGSLAVNEKTITYTPTKVLASVDAFTVLVHTKGEVSIEGGADNQVAFRVYVVPATTVFYEEGFVSAWTGTWTDRGSKGSGTQELQLAGAEGDNNYGYTAAYATNADASSGTQAISKTGGEKAEFTFTGTGVDIYANCDPNTSIVAIMVYNANTNRLEKFYQINTKTKSGTSGATEGQDIAQYSLPIASIMDLSYGNYKVVLQHTKSSSDTEKAIMLDGFRVYNTLSAEQQYITNGTTQTVIYAADEQVPMFIELRDEVLTGVNAINTDSTYKTAGEIIDQVYNESSNLGGALLLGGNKTAGIDVKDLLDNGPKNELFLRKGDVVTFNLGSTNAQIGMKAINGKTSYTITHDSLDATGIVSGTIEKKGTVASSTDMFYEEGVTGAVTIKNTGENILSITKLKVFGVTAQYGSFEFEPLDEEQVTFALKRMIAVTESEEPELPEVPEGDEVAKVPESSGKPESNSKPATSTTPEDSEDSETSTEVEDSKSENVADTSGTTESTDSAKKEDTSKPTAGNETSDAKEETEDTKEETSIKNEESDESVEETVDTESDESIEETDDEDAGTESTGFFGWIVGIFNVIVDFFKNLFV